MKRSDALPSASRNLQVEVGVTEFSWIPAYTPRDRAHGPAVVETWADGYRCEAWYEQTGSYARKL